MARRNQRKGRARATRRNEPLLLPDGDLPPPPSVTRPLREMLAGLPPGVGQIGLAALGRALGIDTSPLAAAGVMRSLEAALARAPLPGVLTAVDQEPLYDTIIMPSSLVGEVVPAEQGRPEPGQEPKSADLSPRERVAVFVARIQRIASVAHKTDDPRALDRIAALAAELALYADEWLATLGEDTKTARSGRDDWDYQAADPARIRRDL